MADSSLFPLAGGNLSDLFVSCIPPPIEADSTLFLCWDSSANIEPAFL